MAKGGRDSGEAEMVNPDGSTGQRSDPAEALRLFVALELPGPIKNMLSAIGKKPPGVRWMPEVNMHLTLRFIGERAPSEAIRIREVLRGVRAAPFSLRIKGTGCFTLPRQTVLWASLAPSPELGGLKQQVDAALQQEVAMPPESGYAPHITLGRAKKMTESDRACFLVSGETMRGEFTAAVMTLFSSRLGQAGALHVPLERYVLGEGR